MSTWRIYIHLPYRRICVKMPRKQNILLKYKCLELCCGKIIREGKWLEHCKTRLRRTWRYDIKRKTTEYKVAGGKLLIYRSASEVHHTVTAAAALAVAEAQEFIHQCSASSDEVGNFRQKYYSLSCTAYIV